MNKLYPFSLDYYNKAVIQKMIDKYDFDEMTAARLFLTSEVHRMLENADLAMNDFSADALLEMWEVEKITGEPRNSLWIRSE